MAHIPYDRPPRCLDIAVDHRIRALFKPISKKNNNDDAGIYLKHIQDLGKDILYRDVPNEEISVTQKFIGNGIGGITVILLQPSNSHPYEQDIETIVEKCPTYTALDECFHAVTCNTLSIHDVSILDSLPFIRGRDKITANDKKRVRKWISLIIEAKKPNVILCMWQDKEGVTLRMSKIQSQGIGGQFDKSPILFGYSVSMERVNAFHPSYAVNYNPNISCFRQLLLLEVTKACHIYEGNWNEQIWMSQLRHTCRDKASLIRTRNTWKLRDFTECFQNHLNRIEKSIISLRSTANVPQARTNQAYETLQRYNITEDCNDASLCIQQLLLHKMSIHPDYLTTQDEDAMVLSVTASLQFLRSIVCNFRHDTIFPPIHIPGSSGYYEKGRLVQILDLCFRAEWMEKTGLSRMTRCFIQNLNASFMAVSRQKYSICLEKLSELFVSFAQNIEDVLGELLESASVNDSLEDILARLGL